MKNLNWPKPGYASITCSTISNILYNLIFTMKFKYSSILITIISCDYLNLSLADEHVGDVTIPTHRPSLSSITKIFSRRISQSDWNIEIKLNYYWLNWTCYTKYTHLCPRKQWHVTVPPITISTIPSKTNTPTINPEIILTFCINVSHSGIICVLII